MGGNDEVRRQKNTKTAVFLNNPNLRIVSECCEYSYYSNKNSCHSHYIFMVRVKKGKAARKHRKHLLKHAKGFRWGRKRKYKAAKDALRHAWEYAYRDRRTKKRDKRQLWQIQINAACRKEGMSYSRFMAGLKKNKIELDRKILSGLAQNHPEILKKILEQVKK